MILGMFNVASIRPASSLRGLDSSCLVTSSAFCMKMVLLSRMVFANTSTASMRTEKPLALTPVTLSAALTALALKPRYSRTNRV